MGIAARTEAEQQIEAAQKQQPNVRLDPVLTWTLVFVAACAGVAILVRTFRKTA